MKIINLILCMFFFSALFAQEETAVLKTLTGNIEGTLLIPEQKTNIPVVLIISGSGPTDRNGNQDEMENNSLKMLAEQFNKIGVASLRYDKRGIGQSSEVSNKDEMEMRIETFMEDVRSWIDLLAADKRFSKIIVAGHSEGSLLGMVASVNNKKVKGFISIAGAGRPADEVIKEQLSTAPDEIKNKMYEMLDKLKRGDSLGDVPPFFYALFRPTIQPYMKSWLKYNPQDEIKKLNMPVLILNGDKDIQVGTKDAELLAKANPKAQLKIIKGMNHVLKTCDTLDKKIQISTTYNNPSLPLNEELCKEIATFMTAFIEPTSPKMKK
ncbi:MAG: alpha/beta hydrolase [Bacteroidia bacterium]|nr:alpha/beta hydrolase [Bacteroidia bacterium]